LGRWFADNLDGSVYNGTENELGSEFCLGNNGNEVEAATDVVVREQKSSHGMDNTRSWVDMEVALEAVEVQKTPGEEDEIDLQTVWQNAVGMDANGPVPMAAAALINVPLK
jgi:hypothetical protein